MRTHTDAFFHSHIYRSRLLETFTYITIFFIQRATHLNIDCNAAGTYTYVHRRIHVYMHTLVHRCTHLFTGIYIYAHPFYSYTFLYIYARIILKYSQANAH